MRFIENVCWGNYEVMTMKKHYRVVSIPRFVIFVALSTFLLLAAIYTVSGICRANAGTAADAVYYTEVTVCPGDTLWSIVEEHYGNDVDKRKIVYDIQSMNDMKDSSLHAGQRIMLPEDFSNTV